MVFDPKKFLADKGISDNTPSSPSTPVVTGGFDPKEFMKNRGIDQSSNYTPGTDKQGNIIDQTTPPYQPQGFGEHYAQAMLPRTFADASDPNAPDHKFGMVAPEKQPGQTDEQHAQDVAAWQAKNRDFMGAIARPAVDMASLVGRHAMADLSTLGDVVKAPFSADTYKNIPENFGKYMSQTKGDNIASDIIRSPATGAAIATGGAGLVPAAVAGAMGTQAENDAQGKDVSPVQAGIDMATGVAAGGALNWATNKVIKIATNKVTGDVWNAIKSFIPKVNEQTTTPINQDLLKEQGIYGRTANEVLSKIKNAIKTQIKDVRVKEAQSSSINDPNLNVNPKLAGEVNKTTAGSNDKLQQLIDLQNTIEQNKSIINDKLQNPHEGDMLGQLVSILKNVGSLGTLSKTVLGKVVPETAGLNTLQELPASMKTTDVNTIRKMVKMEKEDKTISKFYDAYTNYANKLPKLVSDLADNSTPEPKRIKINDAIQRMHDKIDGIKSELSDKLGQPLNDELLGLITGQHISADQNSTPTTPSSDSQQ